MTTTQTRTKLNQPATVHPPTKLIAYSDPILPPSSLTDPGTSAAAGGCGRWTPDMLLSALHGEPLLRFTVPNVQVWKPPRSSRPRPVRLILIIERRVSQWAGLD
jgi:hypothetical protein